MGLLYEKEQRAVGQKAMPELKEPDAIKRSAGKAVAVREAEELDEGWSELDEIIDEDVADDELDAEEFEDEEF